MRKTYVDLMECEGDLHMPNGSILIYVYPSGDVDTIPWPFKTPQDRFRLAAALYDEREGAENEFFLAYLPGNIEFDFEEVLANPEAEAWFKQMEANTGREHPWT
jgi:hypothetical protein